jgi:hypothetical protein
MITPGALKITTKCTQRIGEMKQKELIKDTQMSMDLAALFNRMLQTQS